MHIVRYALDGEAHYGVLKDGKAIARLAAPPFDRLEYNGLVDSLDEAKILPPVDRPRIFGAAYNYDAHTREADKAAPAQPVLFMKPGTAAIGQDDAIIYPEDGEIIHYEGELCVVIGKQARRVSEARALDVVLGYCCGNDVSDRVVQRRESAFGCLLAGKAYDSFAPLGPVIATDLDPSDLRIITRLNGVVRQDASTAGMVFSVRYLIAYISRFITLLPGDVIMTGTPAGVGPIQPGDNVEVEIPGIGVLRNSVAAEA